MTTRPRPVTISDELLDHLLDQAEHTNALLQQMLDRLPAPPEQVASGEPDRIHIREPAAQPKTEPLAVPRRRGRPPKTPREN